jgi:hypothetical protein
LGALPRFSVRDSLWQTQRQSSQMTALKDFDRLEATGLWRASPEDQRREVIVSLGDATLTMSDMNNQALAHWSLAAVQRANGSDIPAIYHPDGDPGETLELPEDEAQMIEGIDYLLRVIERRRPHPGKLRWFLGVGLAAALAAGAVFWLPGARAITRSLCCHRSNAPRLGRRCWAIWRGSQDSPATQKRQRPRFRR